MAIENYVFIEERKFYLFFTEMYLQTVSHQYGKK